MKNRHTIHDVAALLGISTDTIRLYEKEGLVTPLRNPENGYRYYESDEIHRIMGIYLYRQLNVSMSEIKSTLTVSSFPEVSAQFSEFIAKRENRIQELQAEIEKMRFMKHHLERLQEGIDACSLQSLPTGYIIYQQDFAELRFAELTSVFNSPSFSFGNFCYVLSQTNHAQYQTEALRFVIREPMMELTELNSHKDFFPVQSSCQCLYTVCSFPADRPLDWNFDIIFDYAAKMGYQCAPNGYAFYVYSLTSNNSIANFYEIYLPLL